MPFGRTWTMPGFKPSPRGVGGTRALALLIIMLSHPLYNCIKRGTRETRSKARKACIARASGNQHGIDRNHGKKVGKPNRQLRLEANQKPRWGYRRRWNAPSKEPVPRKAGNRAGAEERVGGPKTQSSPVRNCKGNKSLGLGFGTPNTRIHGNELAGMKGVMSGSYGGVRCKTDWVEATRLCRQPSTSRFEFRIGFFTNSAMK